MRFQGHQSTIIIYVFSKFFTKCFWFLLLQKRDYVRLSPVNSLGSSANSSPGNGADPSHDPHSFSNNYRSLAYLPGSVHGASQLQNPQQQQQHNNNNTALPSITTLGNAGKDIQCRFEPGSKLKVRQYRKGRAAQKILTKNRRTALVFFAVKSSYVVKSNYFPSFFGRIYGVVGAPICFWFNLTFSGANQYTMKSSWFDP